MAVSRDDVLHVGGLARIAVPTERLDALVRELNGILGHMDALQRVATVGEAAAQFNAQEGMPLRDDQPPSVPLERPRESFAPRTAGPDGERVPAMRDGFFLVPRLATHEDAGDAA